MEMVDVDSVFGVAELLESLGVGGMGVGVGLAAVGVDFAAEFWACWRCEGWMGEGRGRAAGKRQEGQGSMLRGIVRLASRGRKHGCCDVGVGP